MQPRKKTAIYRQQSQVFAVSCCKRSIFHRKTAVVTKSRAQGRSFSQIVLKTVQSNQRIGLSFEKRTPP